MKKQLFISKSHLRLVYWSLVTLLFIGFVIPVFLFFYLFDAQKVRNTIISQFNTNNYAVNIKGSVFPKTWHGLSVELSDLIITDKTSKNKIITVAKISCQLSWLDMIIGNYKIKRISLNGVDINTLSANATNWHDLLNLTNSNNTMLDSLNYVDLHKINTNGNQIRINDASLVIKNFHSNAEFIFNTQINQYTNIIATGNVNSHDATEVNFENFKIQVKNNQWSMNLDSKATYLLAKQTLFLDKIYGTINTYNYKGNVNIDTLIIAFNNLISQNIKIVLNKQNTHADNNKIDIGIKRINLSQYKYFNFNNIITKYTISKSKSKLELSNTINELVFLTESNLIITNCDNKLFIASDKLKNNAFKANLFGKCSYNIDDDQANFDLTGDINNSKTKLALEINNNKAIPYIKIKADLDNFDMSRITLEKNDMVPIYSDKTNLPLEWLGTFSVDGTLNAKNFSMDRINLSNVKTHFTVDNNELIVDKLNAEAYDGKLTSSFKIKKIDNEYNIALKQKIDNLQLQKIFLNLLNISAINGKGTLNVNVTANNVKSYYDIHNKINGTIFINANQGSFDGIDFDLFVKPTKLTDLSHKRITLFKTLNAQFNFKNGISENGWLQFSSPNVIASGNGIVNLVNSKIDYKLNIKSKLPQNNDKLKSVLIPIKISGDLFAPQVDIQDIQLEEQPVKKSTKNTDKITNSKINKLHKKYHN